jgi:aromatic ring-opening dioxygenase catalytic subunit (LigB family)
MKAERGSMYDQLEASLHEVRRELGQAPLAVLMISGHWEADRFLLSSAAHPPMEYDYSGFPEHTHRIRYDAPGVPALADIFHCEVHGEHTNVAGPGLRSLQ